ALVIGILIAVSLTPAVNAQRAEGEGRRMQGGGINYAPQRAVYTVISTDSYAQTVQMRGKDGNVLSVYVNEDVYNISKLNPGDKIQVNFLEPDGMNNKLAAANIWPVREESKSRVKKSAVERRLIRVSEERRQSHRPRCAS